MNFISKILISNEFEEIKNEMIEQYGINNLRFIPKEVANEFLIEDAKNVEKESYIAENNEKIIIIMANSFKNEAQNFLLKLFEEPPENIKFLIVSPSKNLLLPTIRSRFICEKRKIKQEEININLDLKKMDLNIIFNFLNENENLDKNDLMQIISFLSKESLKYYDLDEKKLEFFYKAYELAKLNSKANILLANLLLNLYMKD